MRDVEQALSTIRELSGLADLALDGDGQAELIFNGDTRVAIARIDETSIELYTELEHLGGDLSRDVLIRLLTANYLGEATGAGRLTLDPRDRVVCYGQRVDVVPLDAPQLEAVFLQYLKYVAFLRSDDAAGLIAGISKTREADLSAGDFMIRI